MAKTKEEREQRKLEAQERAEKRKATKAIKDAAKLANDESAANEPKLDVNELRKNLPISKEHNAGLPALSLPIDAFSKVMKYLPAREFGAISLTCTGYNYVLGGCRVAHVCSRLMRREDEEGLRSSCGSACLVGGLELCSGRKEARVRCFVVELLCLIHVGHVTCTPFFLLRLATYFHATNNHFLFAGDTGKITHWRR